MDGDLSLKHVGGSKRTALFCVITLRVVVICYRFFGGKFSVPSSGVKISGPIGCPETSVGNCHYSLRNNPEERSSRSERTHAGRFKFLDNV